jgi:hypothetical protein
MPDQGADLTDRQLLIRFVDALREVLIAFLERRRDLIPAHLSETTSAAWGPVDEALEA